MLTRIQVQIGAASTLDDPRGHVEWLPAVDRCNWRLWPRLEDYLRRVDRLPPAVLHELNQSTDQTLERLECPARDGRWDRRGLVLGHVQSGKTTHYTALAAKALDAGYEIVIILAGVHNSLRSQTHERIDRHLIGRDSAALIEAVRQHGNANLPAGIVRLVGVGEEAHRLGHQPLPITILTCTTSADEGDFRTNIANQIGFQVSPGSRLVMVVKKHATILRNLIHWLRTQNTVPGLGGAERRIAAPTLVIDDEADHASVDTNKDPDADPRAINRLIRELLISFDRVGFVGYTATPFANIFIPASANHDKYGPDLFPKAFIVNLKAPTDYIGPSLVFGHPGDESVGIAEQLPLPMLVPVTDASTWIPDKHKKAHVPGPLPDSLKEAVRLFVIVCAARACRGDDAVHNSMLVHATRFIDVQTRVAQQIEDEVTGLRNVLGLGSSGNAAGVLREMQEIWQARIVAPHGEFRARLGERCLPASAWTDVLSRLRWALDRIQVMRVNGESADVLGYSRKPGGISVIAIGGDKLSRGLTLEGLSISYFLRTSRMFDTLMQMGRWFGYRPRYADLCRVYTTPYLYSAFREIALAMEDLRSDLDYMARINKDPETFGLRVRTPSDGLLIAAANKIRSGEKVDVRFAGTLVQALDIARAGVRAAENRVAVRHLIESLGRPIREIRGRPTHHFLWHQIPVARVLEFLEGYEALATPSFYNRCDPLRRYITEQARKGELTEWTVAVISKQAGGQTRAVRIAGTEFTLVYRKPKAEAPPERFQTQAVVGSADEDVDLVSNEYAEAMAATLADLSPTANQPQHPDRGEVREQRPAGRGLLLIYLIDDGPAVSPEDFVPSVAVSFPTSKTAAPLTYTVNEIWRQQYGLAGDWDENGESA